MGKPSMPRVDMTAWAMRLNSEVAEQHATITALRDRVAELEQERDEARAQFDDLDELLHQVLDERDAYKARATAAEAAIARLRDEVIEEAAKVLDDRAAGAKLNAQAFRDTQNMPAASNECRRMVSYEACAATIRTLKSNRDTHHETR